MNNLLHIFIKYNVKKPIYILKSTEKFIKMSRDFLYNTNPCFYSLV